MKNRKLIPEEQTSMPNNVKHFSINADDVPRAKTFYEKAFGWQFTA
jgi:predicted enzyme related to lactoylglutathione lyase